ncbi:MAG: group II intron reverse transcriptase/maturase [Myxococcales bacterium]|nr:group II intron reverse transcriptase/maturase [Myxococcales bacterium]
MGTPSPKSVSTKQRRIAKVAREAPDMVFTSLAHHIDLELLQEAHRRTRKTGAAGVDGQTAQEYATNLESNLQRLLDRFKAGTYRAPPVRRVEIPKGDGKSRPIGIPTFEDKVLQRAVAMVLEAVYEQDFLDCSFGFRPGRSAHQALQALWDGLMAMGGGWVLEVDIEDYFGSLNHGQLRAFLDQRVRDGVLRRMIDKWLKAGVMRDGIVKHPETGTPQGGVASPILANIYLHEVLDLWFERDVRPRLRGRSFLIRYADDAAIVFEKSDDAERVLKVLAKRFAKYGLRLHPEKTRLVEFRSAGWRRRPNRGHRQTRPGSFDMLGFRHFWGRTRRGTWVVRRKTSPKKFSQALKRISWWCRKYRHLPIEKQQQALVKKLRGHYGYYGITGNIVALSRFLFEVWRVWRRWLHRRSQRAGMTWKRFERFRLRYPLPTPRIVHSVYRAQRSR